MLLTETALRALIRKLILESEDEDILGEPDLSAENERDDPEYQPPDEDTIDEFNAIGVGGAPAGNIRGIQGPMGTSSGGEHLKDRPVTNGGPSDHLSGKKKRKKRAKK